MFRNSNESKGMYANPYVQPTMQGGHFTQSQNMAGYGYGSGGTTSCPQNVFPSQVQPANVSPTNNFVKTNVIKHIIPHVHPTHTTTVNEHVFQHQHYFPKTHSVVNKCCNQHVFCGSPPPNPCCPPYRSF